MAKASPTGLLPIWNKWVDQKLVKQYGFSYNPTKAKAILAAAGYKDSNGDGFVENKDGSDIDLNIVCPNGWSDWMTSIQVIADSAKAVGIKITAVLPGVRHARRRSRTRAIRPAPRQRPAVQQHAVDVLPVPLPAADPGEPDDSQLRAVRRIRRHGSSRRRSTRSRRATRRPSSRRCPSSRRSTCRISPQSRSGTTGCGRWSIRSTGRTGRPRRARSTRRRPGGTTGR